MGNTLELVLLAGSLSSAHRIGKCVADGVRKRVQFIRAGLGTVPAFLSWLRLWHI
jgi:hypothetical protein